MCCCLGRLHFHETIALGLLVITSPYNLDAQNLTLQICIPKNGLDFLFLCCKVKVLDEDSLRPALALLFLDVLCLLLSVLSARSQLGGNYIGCKLQVDWHNVVDLIIGQILGCRLSLHCRDVLHNGKCVKGTYCQTMDLTVP